MNTYQRVGAAFLFTLLWLFVFSANAWAQGGTGTLPTGPIYLPLTANMRPSTPTFASVPPEAEWTAAWWQWTERLGSLPVYEQGDVDCSLGQSGTPWFLAGSDGNIVLRRCTVPAGKTLLVPVHTVAWNNESYEHLTVNEKRDVLSAVYADTEPGILNSKLCTLESNIQLASEGQPIGEAVDIDSTRLQSPTFRRFDDDEAVSDGYWFAIQLPTGQYVLHFVGRLCDFDTGFPLAFMSVEVTYILNVK